MIQVPDKHIYDDSASDISELPKNVEHSDAVKPEGEAASPSPSPDPRSLSQNCVARGLRVLCGARQRLLPTSARTGPVNCHTGNI